MSFEARNALMLAKKVADKAAEYKKTAQKADGGAAKAKVIPHGDKKREDNLAAFLKDNHPLIPDVVFHGTTDNFSEFDKLKTKDGGFHFGTVEQANMRASGPNKNIMPVHIQAKKLQKSKDMGGNWSSKIKSAKAAGYDGIVYLNRYEGLSSDVIQRLAEQNKLDKLDNLSDSEFSRLVPEAKHSFIVFNPTQIKSATGNQGTFDPTDPDITKADGGEVDDYARGGDVMHTRKVPKPHTPVVGERQHQAPHPASMIPGIHVVGAIHGIPYFTGKK